MAQPLRKQCFLDQKHEKSKISRIIQFLDINQYIEDRPANKHNTYENTKGKSGLTIAFFDGDQRNTNQCPDQGGCKNKTVDKTGPIHSPTAPRSQ